MIYYEFANWSMEMKYWEGFYKINVTQLNVAVVSLRVNENVILYSLLSPKYQRMHLAHVGLKSLANTWINQLKRYSCQTDQRVGLLT